MPVEEQRGKQGTSEAKPTRRTLLFSPLSGAAVAPLVYRLAKLCVRPFPYEVSFDGPFGAGANPAIARNPAAPFDLLEVTAYGAGTRDFATVIFMFTGPGREDRLITLTVSFKDSRGRVLSEMSRDFPDGRIYTPRDTAYLGPAHAGDKRNIGRFGFKAGSLKQASKMVLRFEEKTPARRKRH